MNKVIVFGSLNMDLSIGCSCMPAQGETLQGFDFVMNPGGKGGNQAVACAKNGGDTWMIAQVGNDYYGKLLLNSLNKYGVRSDFVSVIEGSTGVAVIVRANHDNRIILSAGVNDCMKPKMPIKLLEQYAKPGDIYLTQFENNLDAVLAGLQAASAKGLYTVVNPAPAKQVDNRLYQSVNMFVLNQSETKFLCGEYPDSFETCSSVLDWFENRQCDAIITMGSKGSVASFKGKRYRIPAYQVHVVDTTGAGDTFIGVICSELARHTAFVDALRKATIAAALTVTKMGAQCAIPTQCEIDRLIKDMQQDTCLVDIIPK